MSKRPGRLVPPSGDPGGTIDQRANDRFIRPLRRIPGAGSTLHGRTRARTAADRCTIDGGTHDKSDRDHHPGRDSRSAAGSASSATSGIVLGLELT